MNPEDEICFYDPSTFPTEQTALDYFRNSPFYDKTCNNEILHMQLMYSNHKLDINDKLRQMVGIEYSFRETISNIFVIQKCYRKDYNNTVLLDLFYILNGVIYKAPTDKSIFTSRFINFSHLLNKSFDIINDNIELYEENNIKENDEELKEILKILSDYKLR